MHHAAKFIRNSVIHLAGTAISALLTLALIALIVRAVPQVDYGIWVAAISFAAVLMFLDFGGELTIVRAVAAKDKQGDQTRQLLSGFLFLSILIGICGFIVLAGSGYLFTKWLSSGLTPALFLIAGLTFLAQQLLRFSNAILIGLQRFALYNAFATGSLLLRVVGTYILIRNGGGIVSLAWWHCLTIAVQATVSVAVAISLYPFGFSSQLPRLQPGGFALYTQLATLSTRLLWESGPLWCGALLNAAAIVPLHIGQRIPFALSVFHDRIGNVLFPAVASSAAGTDFPQQKDLLLSVSSWIAILVLPIVILLWVYTPLILRVWTGGLLPGAVMVMRLTLLAVFIDACSTGSLHFLWASGKTKLISSVLGTAAISFSLLTLLLLPVLGISGAAVAFLAGITASSIVFIIQAMRLTGASVVSLISYIARKSAVPLLTLAFIIGAIAILAPHLHSDFRSALALSPAILLIYCAVLYSFSMGPEERNKLSGAFFFHKPDSEV